MEAALSLDRRGSGKGEYADISMRFIPHPLIHAHHGKENEHFYSVVKIESNCTIQRFHIMIILLAIHDALIVQRGVETASRINTETEVV